MPSWFQQVDRMAVITQPKDIDAQLLGTVLPLLPSMLDSGGFLCNAQDQEANIFPKPGSSNQCSSSQHSLHCTAKLHVMHVVVWP